MPNPGNPEKTWVEPKSVLLYGRGRPPPTRGVRLKDMIESGMLRKRARRPATARWSFAAPFRSWSGVLLTSLVLSASALPQSAEADSGPSLSVPISTVRNSSGKVYVALYDANNWLKPGRFVALRLVPARPGTVVAHFSSVRPGQYSVAVFHDENNNGTVDRNFLGLPSEGFGFSRRTPFRVPSFKETSFELHRSGSMPVLLRY